MALPLIPLLSMAGIGIFLEKLVVYAIEFFILHGLARMASVLAAFTFVIGFFLTFTAGIFLAVEGLTILVPVEFTFFFGLIPSTIKVYYGIYITALTSKRIFDWTSKIYESSMSQKRSMAL